MLQDAKWAAYDEVRSKDLARLTAGQRSRLEEISDRLMLVGSHKRAPRLADELSAISNPQLFWFVLQDKWPVLDDAWIASFDIMRSIKRTERLRPEWMHSANRTFYEGLPDRFMVYRGCSLDRRRGMAWTTERPIAEDFARGHRGIRTPDPVIATATINKASRLPIFCNAERKESEIVLNSRHSAFRLTWEPWTETR